MRTLVRVLFFALCCFVSTTYGQIQEAARFRDIAKHLKPGTLILLDIDDTILIPAQMVGSDEWFNVRWKKHEAAGHSKSVALEKALAEWESVRHITKMKTVEKRTHILIQKLQKKGYQIMGLTNQGLALATRTVQQLGENKIDLSATSPTAEDYYVNLQGHSILFRKGILFTSGKHKGEAFFKFCDNFGLKPQRVVCLDDKGSHLAAIEAEAQKRGIEFVGLRYAFADRHKAEFRPEIADYQFMHSSFAKLLSDEEAQSRMVATVE